MSSFPSSSFELDVMSVFCIVGMVVLSLHLFLLAGLLLFPMMFLLLCPSPVIHDHALGQYQFLLVLCLLEQVVSDICQFLLDVAVPVFWSCLQCFLFLDFLLFLKSLHFCHLGGVKYLFGITPPMMTFVCPVRKGWLANVVPSFDVKKTFGLNVWDDSSIKILPP